MPNCEICNRPIPFDEYNNNTICDECEKKKHPQEKDLNERIAELHKIDNAVQVLTIMDIPTKKVVKYFDILSTETVIGTGPLSEIFASFSDLLGTTSQAYQDKLDEARKSSILRLKAKALELGANAVIGAKFEYVSIGKEAMFMVAVAGTPVIVE